MNISAIAKTLIFYYFYCGFICARWGPHQHQLHRRDWILEIVDVENAGKNLPALTDSQTTPGVCIILLRKQDKSCCNIGLHVEECRFLQQDITTGSIIAQHIEQVP